VPSDCLLRISELPSAQLSDLFFRKKTPALVVCQRPVKSPRPAVLPHAQDFARLQHAAMFAHRHMAGLNARL
jgi:hypothetical protein